MGLPEGYVYRGFKTAIVNPTSEQVAYFRGVSGACRWVYNLYLDLKFKSIRNYKNIKGAPRPFGWYDFSRFLTVVKNCTCDPNNDYTWLNDYEREALNNAMRDAESSFIKWAKGTGGRPKFKSKKSSVNFRTDYKVIRRIRNGCFCSKVYDLKLSRPLPKCPDGLHYASPTISFDKLKNKWYLSVSVPVKVKPKKTSGEVVGVDLGLVSTAVTSYGKVYENINDTNDRIKKLEHRKKVFQRRASKLLRMNIDHYKTVSKGTRVPVFKKPLSECKNYQKALKKVDLIQRKLNGIRSNFTHQMTHEIITRPETSVIVIEDLNVSGMMKDHHQAKRVSEQRWYKIRQQLKYKSEEEGITLITTDRFYPSSKNCSCCGHKKTNLRRDERIYVCPNCGQVIDRDLNAAINLAEYGLQKLPDYYGKVTPVDEFTKPQVDGTLLKKGSREAGRDFREGSQWRASQGKSRISVYLTTHNKLLRRRSDRILSIRSSLGSAEQIQDGCSLGSSISSRNNHLLMSC